MYSLWKRSQISVWTCLTNSHFRVSGSLLGGQASEAGIFMDRPVRNWNGVSAGAPWASPEFAYSGLLFMMPSILHTSVPNSSDVRFFIFVIRFVKYLNVFTAASQRPPNVGLHLGMNSHSISCSAQFC